MLWEDSQEFPVAGCISVSWRVMDNFPTLREAPAQNCVWNRQQILGSSAAPTHAWTTKAGFELLACTFDHPTADHPAFFPHLHVIHVMFVVLKVASFCQQVYLYTGLLLCRLPDLKNNLFYLTLIEQAFPFLQPTLGWRGAFSKQQLGCAG